jgi:hypothetical protein
MADGKPLVNDDDVLDVLSHLASEIREARLGSQELAVHTARDARDLIRQLIQAEAGISIDPDRILPDAGSAEGPAQDALRLLLEDPETAAIAQPLIEAPPAFDQRVIETAAGAAIVLGALVTWLQTKLEIEVSRGKSGKVNFRFAMAKNPSDQATVKTVTASVVRLLGIG